MSAPMPCLPALTVVTLAPHRFDWLRGCFADSRCPPILLRWEARDPALYAERFMLFQAEREREHMNEAAAI